MGQWSIELSLLSITHPERVTVKMETKSQITKKEEKNHENQNIHFFDCFQSSGLPGP